MTNRSQSSGQSSPSENPPTRGAPSNTTSTSPSGTVNKGKDQKEDSESPHWRDQGGQEATQRVEAKKRGQEGEREEIVKEEEGKRRVAGRTSNRPAPAAGGVGGPMGTEEGRKEGRGKL